MDLGIDWKDAGMVLGGGALGGILITELDKYSATNATLAKYPWLMDLLVGVGGAFAAGYGKKKHSDMIMYLGYGLLAAGGYAIADYFFNKYENKSSTTTTK